MTLHVASFGGGVALEGAADTRRIDEVLQADGLDIGARGALVATAGITDYTTLEDFEGNAWTALHALYSMSGVDFVRVAAVGEGKDSSVPPELVYLSQIFNRLGAASSTPVGSTATVFQIPTAPFAAAPVLASGVVVTSAVFPGVFEVQPAAPGPNALVNVCLVCLGAREGFAPRSAPGLYVLMAIPPSADAAVYGIGLFDALGTGAWGELPVGGGAPGTEAVQLYPRGVVVYNNHAFIWGFDESDAVNGDGPNRVMFCNLGKPLKWGNDNQANVGTDRAFTDSDAIVLGGAGEIVRAGIAYAGRLYFGTDRGLHYIAGYGRDSFITDGAFPVMNAFNTVGPHGLIEGPDRLLYGVSDQGLWSFDGAGTPAPLFLKLVNFEGRSPGYWDLIWMDGEANPDDVPGRTNQDLVWTAVDWERHQVLVGVPYCNASAGVGRGSDTVVIKYHPRTGGFTRQVFTDVVFTAAGYFRRVGQQPEARLLGTATPTETTVQRFGYGTTPVLPSPLPAAQFGYYVPFTPDGVGTLRSYYLTLAWRSVTALPIVLELVATVDETEIDTATLYIQSAAPSAPAVGDFWLDTSRTNSSLGNQTAGVGIPARSGYFLYVRQTSGWRFVDGTVATGTRTTIRLPLPHVVGARVTLSATCLAAAGRFQFEGIGLDPGEAVAAG